jgi:hypothetical protein
MDVQITKYEWLRSCSRNKGNRKSLELLLSLEVALSILTGGEENVLNQEWMITCT